MYTFRVFLFQEGDKGTKDSATSKGIAKIFCKAVKEATAAHTIWSAARARKEEEALEKKDKKPAPYKHVKVRRTHIYYIFIAYGSVLIFFQFL